MCNPLPHPLSVSLPSSVYFLPSIRSHPPVLLSMTVFLSLCLPHAPLYVYMAVQPQCKNLEACGRACNSEVNELNWLCGRELATTATSMMGFPCISQGRKLRTLVSVSHRDMENFPTPDIERQMEVRYPFSCCPFLCDNNHS